MLYEHAPRLRRYARALTRNAETADDLVQDSLERAWRKRDRWEAGTDLRAWLFTVMHNVYVNGLRRRRPETVPMEEHDCADTQPSGQERAMGCRDVEVGLALLPTEQREVLLLVCLEEMSYEQVATVLGIPIGTVMSRLHRGRERLRKWMAGEDQARPALRRIK